MDKEYIDLGNEIETLQNVEDLINRGFFQGGLMLTAKVTNQIYHKVNKICKGEDNEKV